MPDASIGVRALHASETKPLRHLVLWPHIENESDCVMSIDDDHETLHLGCIVDDIVASVGTIYPESSAKIQATRPYRLRAMATHPDYRRQHLGEMLLQHAFKTLLARGCDVLWCDARLVAVPFYTSLGFRVLPEIYDVPLIGPHQFMWKEIK
jgi:ribosomal protein S18 acetylase RimI-like enzyme